MLNLFYILDYFIYWIILYTGFETCVAPSADRRWG